MKAVGDYVIINKIGEGGMGFVYKAQDATLGRTVVIKALRPSLLSDPDIIRRFVNERLHREKNRWLLGVR